jgi:hypothetical protein
LEEAKKQKTSKTIKKNRGHKERRIKIRVGRKTRARGSRKESQTFIRD